MGFRKLGRAKFYRVKDDVILYFCLERASLIYLWYGIHPLFVPREFFCFAFGSRIRERFKDMPILDRETDDTVVDRFCEMLEYHYMNEIEPFWSKNTTAGNLVELAEQGMSWGNPKNHIPMNANGHAELLMYGNAYLGNYEKAITEAEKRIGVVPSLRYTEGAVKSEIDKARSLIRLISTSDNEQMTATFQAWREENCRLFGLKDQMRCIPARSTQE